MSRQVGRHAQRITSIALCLATLLAAPASQAGWLDGIGNLWPFGGGSSSEEKRVQEWQSNPAQELRWGDWERLRVVPSGTTTPNQHPVQLTPEQVAIALMSIQARPFKDDYPLFSEEELKRFSGPIAIALSKADPGQDVEFLSMGQHGIIGLLAPNVANAGRIFFADGRLNVIIGTMHKDFMPDYLRGSKRKPEFNFGSRETSATGFKIVGVDRGDGKLIREDWIAVAIGAGRSAPTVGNAFVPGGAAAAPAIDPADALARKNEARLKALQRLKDQGLLTDEEYKQKRSEVIKEL